MVVLSEIFCARLTLFVTFLGLRLCLTLFFALDLYWKLRSSGAHFDHHFYGWPAQLDALGTPGETFCGLLQGKT